MRGTEIIRELADLGLSEPPTAMRRLSRQLLEVFISLQWVISDLKRVNKYSEFAFNELDRLAQMAMKDGLLAVKSREDNTNVTEDFLSSREKPKKGISFEQQAREAELFHIYQIFYRFMSLDTHGKSETIIAPEDRIESTLVHLQTIGAISQAFGHVAILWLMHR